jgi:hypothetical protein
MNVCFGPRGILQIDDAKLMFKNFEGRGDKFNREGDRNFSIRIDDPEVADALIEEGWNVKIKPGRDEDEGPFMRLPVKVKFTDFGPKVYLKSGKPEPILLDEESIAMLDQIEIECADLDIRPFDWEVNGRTGRTAYLQAGHITQRIDRFAARYANMSDDEKLPF